MVGFNLVGTGVSMGNEGVIDICGSICETRKEDVGLISRILLLFAFGVAYSFVLILYNQCIQSLTV